MHCPYCDKRIHGDSVLCPVCGSAVSRPESPKVEATAASSRGSATNSPGLLWYVALALLASTLFSATVALGILGAEHGLQIRRERASLLGSDYYQRGLIHLEQGNYLLAMAEFEEAVRLAPDHEDAQEQLALLQTLLGVEASGPSGASPEVLLNLYGQASALYQQGAWSEAIVRLEELRSLDASYRTQQVEEMLFDAYQGRGRALLEAGRVEEALSVLEKALQLRPDDPDVAEIHAWLGLYMEGLAHWDVDSEGAVEPLRELHALNPTFLDVEIRLHDALLSLGDSYHDEGAWCVAESRYEEALRVMPSESAQAKRDQARDLCLQAIAGATPSPVASSEPALSTTTTLTPVPPSHPGEFVGQFVDRSPADATEMRIRVCVLDHRGVGMRDTGVELSSYGWRSDTMFTGDDGCCRFAGLTRELEFEVRLIQLPCVPIRVKTQWGTEAQVEFVEG
jgi:tetratricopeptide (TPR) repeat protein